jgi:hypothetical protein
METRWEGYLRFAEDLFALAAVLWLAALVL